MVGNNKKIGETEADVFDKNFEASGKMSFQKFIRLYEKYEDIINPMLYVENIISHPGDSHTYYINIGEKGWGKSHEELFSFPHFGFEGKPIIGRELLLKKSSKPEKDRDIYIPTSCREKIRELLQREETNVVSSQDGK